MIQCQRADQLNDRLGVLIAQHHAIGAEIVEMIAELDEIEGWQGDGYRSQSHWLSVRGSYTMSEASRFARAAARLEHVRSIHADARDGRCSVGVLAMAARVATSENEATVRKIVRDATPSQAARIFAKYRECESRNGDPKPDPDVDYWRKRWRDGLGRERWEMALDGPTSALMEEAWQAARAAGERDLDPTDLEQRRRLTANEIATRMAQLIVDAANRAGMTTGGDRLCVQVSADLETLARVLGFDFDPTKPVGLGGHCFIPSTGHRLDDGELAGILCESSVQLLVHHNGVPLWLGNEVRSATRHQRRALVFRAGVKGCEFPGCTQTRFVDAHHVRWFTDHGATDLDNLALLCSYHHKQIHEKACSITTAGDQAFTFWRGSRCLGTTTRGDSTGRPPDLAALPLIEQLPDPPPRFGSATPCSTGGGERLTNFGLSVFVEHLLAA